MIETGLTSVWTQLDRVHPLHLSVALATLLALLTFVRRRMWDGRSFFRSDQYSKMAAP